MRHVLAFMMIAVASSAMAQTKPSVPIKAPPATQENETLTIGTVELTLGEPKDRAISKLVSAGYILTPVQGTEAFLVKSRTSTSADAIIGQIDCEGGKRLTYIQLDYEVGKTPDILANSFYYAVKHLAAENCRNVQLATNMTDASGAEVKHTLVFCSGSHRIIKVITGEVGGQRFVELVEALTSEHN